MPASFISRRVIVAVLTLALGTLSAADHAPSPLTWQPWSDDVFALAKREHRIVLLDLEAVWCHWCHVMDETTYRDPAVVALLTKHYLLVRVDQDSRPDLANRYEDFGWPATILFDADGHELVKQAGYIPPPRMVSLLQAVVDDPTPGPSVRAEAEIVPPTTAVLDPNLRREMEVIFRDGYDPEHAGWGRSHKYLDAHCVEYALRLAAGGDADAERMARSTLTAAKALFDPVWGGVYQYSTGGVWSEPHFEKIMSFQADYLRTYACAYALWRDPVHLAAAQEVRRFLRSFLTSPEGAFYISQDADLKQGEHSEAYFALDDAGRRALGVPRVDTHVYARDNGWAIAALAELHAVSGDPGPRDEAVRAARWILAHRTLPGGGFRHDERDTGGPFLGDTLAMGEAFLALYSATGEREWLGHATAAAGFISHTFPGLGANGVGVITAAAASAGLPPLPQRDENIAVARFASLLAHHTGDRALRALAERAFRYLAAPAVAQRRQTGGTLLAADELEQDPLHVTVVGPKDDARAAALFRTATALPGTKRIEWLDRRDGPLPNPDIELPALTEPAAFLCAAGRCSLPATTPEQLQVRANKARR